VNIRFGYYFVITAHRVNPITWMYERVLGETLPFGITHLVYISNNFDQDVAKAIEAGSIALQDRSIIKAGFGEHKVAFLRAPNGWIFEIIEIIENLVPEV
jgi:hypothetical protein